MVGDRRGWAERGIERTIREAQERGDWDAVGDAARAVGVAPAAVNSGYTEALAWARERLATAE